MVNDLEILQKKKMYIQYARHGWQERDFKEIQRVCH